MVDSSGSIKPHLLTLSTIDFKTVALSSTMFIVAVSSPDAKDPLSCFVFTLNHICLLFLPWTVKLSSGGSSEVITKLSKYAPGFRLFCVQPSSPMPIMSISLVKPYESPVNDVSRTASIHIFRVNKSESYSITIWCQLSVHPAPPTETEVLKNVLGPSLPRKFSDVDGPYQTRISSHDPS